MLAINLRTDQAFAALQPYLDRAGDLTGVLQEVGGNLVESTIQRFSTSTAPDGTPWAPNAQSTLDAYTGTFGKSLRQKDGNLNKKGAAKLGAKKPLRGETGRLENQSISYQVIDSQTLHVGSDAKQANVMQFGAQSGELGFGLYKTRNGSFPIPWGDIPARPFIGLSDDDRRMVLDVFRDHLSGSA